MKNVLSLFLLLSANFVLAGEPSDLKEFLSKHPELSKVEGSEVSSMRKNVPFADAVYKYPIKDPEYRKWVLSSDGKIIAYYIELITTLDQERANSVVGKYYEGIGFGMISSGGGFFPPDDMAQGSDKLFFLYGDNQLYRAAEQRFDDEVRRKEDMEAERILNFLRLEKEGSDQAPATPKSGSEGRE